MSQDLVELDSIETSPQGVPVWNDAVGSDYDVERVIGQPARTFSVAVGGLLALTFETGNSRLCRVVSGKDYYGRVRSVQASGSTAYGLIFWE